MADNYPSWLKRVAQTGLISKGAVYFIFGVLIIMATFIPSDDPVGLFELVKYIIHLGWGGRLLVALMAIGLFCYSAWKFFQMIYNVEGYKDDFMGYFVRITWLGPFLFYLVLGGHAFIQLFKWYSGTFVYFQNQASTLYELLYSDGGKWIVASIAFALFVNAVSLFYLAFTGKYTIMLNGRGFYQRSPHVARLTGLIGYLGYGITLLLMAILFGISVYYTNAAFANGHHSLFYYLITRPFGRGLLSIIALGTVCYGLYFLLSSFYRWREPS